jgi:ATP-dependent Lon protease
MEVIRLSGYITEEKLAIAKHHLWPRVLEKAGLKKSQLAISEGAHAPRHRGLRARSRRAQSGKAAGTGGTQGRGQDPRRRADTPIKIGIKEDRGLPRQAGIQPRKAAELASVL